MPVLLRRQVALPTEHGSWAFLLSPLLIGLFAAGTWRLTTTYLVVAAFCAFLVRQPITRAIKAWSGRTSGGDLGAALVWALIYGGIGLLHVAGLVLRGEGYILWLAVPGVPVFAWYLWLVWHRAERRQLLVEVVGAGALALSAPAALWIGRGAALSVGWALFGLAWGHTTFMIALAYLRLTQRRWTERPTAPGRWRAARLPLLIAAGELLVVAVAAGTGHLPVLMGLPYFLQLAIAVNATHAPALGLDPQADRPAPLRRDGALHSRVRRRVAPRLTAAVGASRDTSPLRPEETPLRVAGTVGYGPQARGWRLDPSPQEKPSMGGALTVQQVALAQPPALRVYARRGIDFLREGGLTLEAACHRHGLDATAVTEEIEQEAAGAGEPWPDWSGSSDSQLIDYVIETYHRPMRKDLARIEMLARASYQAQDTKDTKTLSRILRTCRDLKAEIELHLLKEEGVLFPMMRRGQNAMTHAPVSVMFDEHDVIADALRSLRTLMDGYACADEAGGSWLALCRTLATFETDMHLHMLMEHHVLYARALAREKDSA